MTDLDNVYCGGCGSKIDFAPAERELAEKVVEHFRQENPGPREDEMFLCKPCSDVLRAKLAQQKALADAMRRARDN